MGRVWTKKPLKTIRAADSLKELYAKAVTNTSEFLSQMSFYGISRCGSDIKLSTVYYSRKRSKVEAYLKSLPEHDAVHVYRSRMVKHLLFISHNYYYCCI